MGDKIQKYSKKTLQKKIFMGGICDKEYHSLTTEEKLIIKRYDNLLRKEAMKNASY